MAGRGSLHTKPAPAVLVSLGVLADRAGCCGTVLLLSFQCDQFRLAEHYSRVFLHNARLYFWLASKAACLL